MVTKERHLHEQSTQCCYLHQPQCNAGGVQQLSGDSLRVYVCARARTCKLMKTKETGCDGEKDEG